VRLVGFRAVVVALLVGLVPIACSNGSSQSTSSSSKTVVYATPSLALTMDPCFLPGQQTAEILQNLYWEWVNYKVQPGPGGIQVDNTQDGEAAMTSGVLDSWNISSDGTVYTLHLHKGVTDSSGNELKADDMRWILDRTAHSAGCNFVTNTESITDVSKQVKVLDAYTLEVTLPAPDAQFLRALNVNNGMAFGAATARKHTTASDPWAYEWMKRNAPATGPYMLQTWTPGVEQVLVRNPHWFGPKPSIDKIIYRQVPSDSNRLALMLNGSAQIARDLTQDELDNISKNSSKGVNVQCIAANQFVYAALNFATGPTSQPAVRQALAYATPYADILSSVYHTRAKRLYGMVTSNYVDYLGDSAYPYNTDVNKAKQLLASAGYPNGFTATVLVDAGQPIHSQIAVLLKDAFSKIGVTLNIDQKPTAAFQDTAFGRKFGDMVLDQNYSFILDPDYHSQVWVAYGPPPNFNFGSFVNDEFIGLQKAGVTTPEGPARATAMKRLQQIFNDQVVWLSVANAPTCFAFSNKVSGYVWHTHNQIIFTDLKVA
jgi:peptide/nickel transport system substrate-binding protein